MKTYCERSHKQPTCSFTEDNEAEDMVYRCRFYSYTMHVIATSPDHRRPINRCDFTQTDTLYIGLPWSSDNTKKNVST